MRCHNLDCTAVTIGWVIVIAAVDVALPEGTVSILTCRIPVVDITVLETLPVSRVTISGRKVSVPRQGVAKIYMYIRVICCLCRIGRECCQGSENTEKQCETYHNRISFSFREYDYLNSFKAFLCLLMTRHKRHYLCQPLKLRHNKLSHGVL